MMEEAWIGMESLQDSIKPASPPDPDNTTEDHVVWVIVPNTGNLGSNDSAANAASANSSMVISSTTETVYDAHGNKTNIQIAEITHQKKKMGRRNNEGNRYTCDICGLKYTRNFNLRRHKDSAHGGNSVQISCPFCPSTFTRHDNLTQHIKFIHNNLGCHQCQHCGKQFARKHTMEDHIKVQHHKLKKYQCVKCQKVFGYAWSLYNHVRVTHECDGAFKCYYCTKVFSTIKNLRNHVLSIHEGVRYKCKICHRVLKCQSAYKSHLKAFHLPKAHAGLYLCSRCNFKCTSKNDLIKHMRLKHKWTLIHVCPICHKAVRHRLTYDRHLLMHNQTDNDISTLLQSLSGTNSIGDMNDRGAQVAPQNSDDYQASLIVSTSPVIQAQPVPTTNSSESEREGATMFECSFCSKVFNTRYLLDKHYEKFHSYVCNFCSALFLSYEAIQFHQAKFHQGESGSHITSLLSNDCVHVADQEEPVTPTQSLDDPENPIWSLEEMAELIDDPLPAEDWIVEETTFDDEVTKG